MVSRKVFIVGVRRAWKFKGYLTIFRVLTPCNSEFVARRGR